MLAINFIPSIFDSHVTSKEKGTAIRILFVTIFLAFGFIAPAYAMSCYLVKQEDKNNQTFCYYDNGTVLNIGMKLMCPTKIDC